jgi:(S)-ureidoglycine aminohydrolase
VNTTNSIVAAQPFGVTRSRVAQNYALITPDTQVASVLVGWRNASAVIHISPEMGARFLQYTTTLEPDAASAVPGEGIERFVFVVSGEVSLKVQGRRHELAAGGFAFLPADVEHRLTTSAQAKAAARMAVFEKRYQAAAGAPAPAPRVGHERDVAGEAFLGDADLRLQVLLPPEPAFDLAVNVFTYQPGATLPQVEIHVMEHGLLMLDGAGVYRLGDDYHPVQAGDVIWMAPYCPQWFVAMGKQPARYVYYKDIHRDRLTGK